jgi:D-serine ammonia-lyase
MFSPYLNHDTRSTELARIRKEFVGRKLGDLPTPAAIVDRNIVASHCEKMLIACRELGLGFRAHIKTHKVRTGEI